MDPLSFIPIGRISPARTERRRRSESKSPKKERAPSDKIMSLARTYFLQDRIKIDETGSISLNLSYLQTSLFESRNKIFTKYLNNRDDPILNLLEKLTTPIYMIKTTEIESLIVELNKLFKKKCLHFTITQINLSVNLIGPTLETSRQALAQIKELNLSNTLISAKFLTEIAKHFKFLKTLKLNNCKKLFVGLIDPFLSMKRGYFKISNRELVITPFDSEACLKPGQKTELHVLYECFTLIENLSFSLKMNPELKDRIPRMKKIQRLLWPDDKDLSPEHLLDSYKIAYDTLKKYLGIEPQEKLKLLEICGTPLACCEMAQKILFPHFPNASVKLKAS